MRIVGKRNIRMISKNASSQLLKQGVLFNDEIHKLPTGNTTYMPKGVYRYKSHEDANRHWEECLIKGIAKNVRRRV